ncbi:cation:proton antiporter [Phytohabitans flavus]|uniref:Transporter n=1 Tax=Phytohabitans flavus TaxID=1076124 RepID=A0A6F8Y8D0_9ACTN|nr:cation:proton antiporter [Phytohabitans flavus]BCB82366.1 transporter [Phytohabitans flavus]
MHIGDALVALGGAFLAAAVLARLGARIGLPTIPLFMLAGVVFGPHTPGIALVEDPGDLALIAALGLVFLLFYLGLEFHTDDLVAGGRRMLAAGLGYLVLNIGGGLALGFAFGWGTREALVIAGVIGISSSAIVTKLLVETGRLRNPESRLILGVIVIEDIFLALYLAILQPVLGNASGPAEVATDLAKAFAFLIALAALARWGARAAGRLLRVFNDELLVVFFVGLAVLSAGVAEELGVSDAIGAFMIGLVLGGSTAAERVRSLVRPLRDGFAAIFFFTFGLTIDPGDIGPVLVPIAVAVAITVVLNIAAGVLAARLHGYGRQEAANIGLTVLTRGEFSLILGSLAVAAGLDSRIAPFVAGYVLVLAVIGPLAVLRSEKLAAMFAGRRSVHRERPGSTDKMPAMIVAPAQEGSSTEPGDTRRTTSTESR